MPATHRRPTSSRSRPRRCCSGPCLILLLATALRAADEKAPPRPAAEPPLERLVELNAAVLYGGEVKVERDRFTLQLPGDGSFARGFDTGRAGLVADPAELKDPAARKELLAGATGRFSVAGLGRGSAVSRFELADEWVVSFKLRIPSLPAGARMTWRFQQDAGGKEYIQSSFLQDLQLRGKGKDKAAASGDSRFAGRPDAWFDQRSPGVPVEIRFRDRTLTIRMAAKPAPRRAGAEPKEKRKAKGRGRGRQELVDVVSLGGIESPTAGRLGLSFEGCSFLISDLEIRGKLPRAWLTRELDALRQVGKLFTRPEDAAAGGVGKKPVKPDRKKGPDISKPDPEADEEL